ncbi:MAG: PilZ domain-containing protein [Chloroflexi bacterium]|nr:PilZ domain-containing protein [Chloroflexota bacterium]
MCLAQIAAVDGGRLTLLVGAWEGPTIAGAAGTPALVRRLDAGGVAEWEGVVATSAAPGAPGTPPYPSPHTAPLSSLPLSSLGDGAHRHTDEMAITVQLAPGSARGRLHQRRRSTRLPVRLTPVRLQPLPTGEATSPDTERPRAARVRAIAPPDAGSAAGDVPLPVARLTDISAHGAGIVIDCPLPTGTAVALEFDLPGGNVPFTVQGRVIEPAVRLHGQAQPQADGLPGFQRGIEFLGTAAGREYRRLAAALSTLLRGK